MPINVPFPSGACIVDDWFDAGTPHAGHYFEGRRWIIKRRQDRNRDRNIDVYVSGVQHPHGSVDT